MINQTQILANRTMAFVEPVRGFLHRHDVISRMMWLGVAQTAVLVAMELSDSLMKRGA